MYKYKTTYEYFVVALWVIATLSSVKCEEDEEDSGYQAVFTGDPESCDGFENKDVIVGLHVSATSGLFLGGNINIKADLDTKMEVKLEIEKLENGGTSNPVMKAVVVLCESLKDEDAPWSDVVKAMGLTECPIPIDDYGVANITINMDSAKPYITEEYEGEYRFKMILEFGKDTVSCYAGNFGIIKT